MVKSVPGQPLSIQFQILTTADQLSLNEYPNAKFNTSNENATTKDSNKSSVFADNLFITKPDQHHRKKETYNGNCVQNNDNASKARDGIAQSTFRETALNTISIIFSLTFEGILIWSSKSCKGNLMEYSRNWLSRGTWASA